MSSQWRGFFMSNPVKNCFLIESFYMRTDNFFFKTTLFLSERTGKLLVYWSLACKVGKRGGLEKSRHDKYYYSNIIVPIPSIYLVHKVWDIILVLMGLFNISLNVLPASSLLPLMECQILGLFILGGNFLI